MAIHKICTLQELSAKGRLVLEIENIEILILKVGDEVFATSNICPHAETKLELGIIEKGTITCSGHGTCFDLKTGEIRLDMIEDEDLLEMIDPDNLPFGPLKTYEIRVDGSDIYVTL